MVEIQIPPAFVLDDPPRWSVLCYCEWSAFEDIRNVMLENCRQALRITSNVSAFISSLRRTSMISRINLRFKESLV